MTQHIASNHMDMCRFRGVQDPEYRKVIGALDLIRARMSEKRVDIEQSSTQVRLFALIRTLNRYRCHPRAH